MLKINLTPPPVLAAQKEIKKYQKPMFEVINLDMESPLLAGSGIPTKKNIPVPKVDPIGDGGDL